MRCNGRDAPCDRMGLAAPLSVARGDKPEGGEKGSQTARPCALLKVAVKG